MLIHDAYITGSLILNGVDIGDITGSEAEIGNLNQFSASINSYTASINSFTQSVNNTTASLSSSIGLLSGSYLVSSASFDTRILTNSSSIGTLSSSFLGASSSFDTRILNNSSSIGTLSSSFLNASSSFDTRILNNSSSIGILSSSFLSTSSSLNSRVGTIESRYATTGSNNFTGTQQISATNNAISFTSTASFYTDGGMRITKDMYVSGNAFFNNVTVFGTQSISYITSSQLNIGTNIITVNTDTPSIRFGGLAVYDSGSTGLTGSLLWDSEDNHWVYSNPSGSSYDGGMMISGPRNSSGLGNEQGTTACALMMGQGGDHITSSAIFSYGNATCFYGNATITSTGVGCFASTVCAPAFVGGTICGTTGTFNNQLIASSVAGGTAAIFQNTGAQNSNGIELRGGTAGTAVNWKIEKDNTLSNALQITPSTAAGGTTYTTPVWTLTSVGVACFLSTVCSPAFVGGTVSGTTGTFSGKICANTAGTVTSGFADGLNLGSWDAVGYTSAGTDLVLGGYRASQWSGVQIHTSGASRLAVSSTGIACFACRVCVPAITITGCAATTIIDAYNQNTDDGNGFYIKAGGVNSGKYVMALESAAGCSRMIVLASGNVGIGTTSFLNSSNVQISTNSGNTCAVIFSVYNTAACPSTTAQAQIGLGFINGNTSYTPDGICLGEINYFGQGNNAGYGGASIKAILVSGGGNTSRTCPSVDLVLYTKPKGDTGVNERMRITGDGIACFACNVIANGDFNIRNTSFSTTGTLNKITWTNLYPSTYNVADIGVQLDGNYYNGAIVFRTADADNANVLVERMRMESRGVTCFRNTVCAPQFMGGFVCGTGGLRMAGATTTWSSISFTPDNPGGGGDQCKTVLAARVDGCTGWGPQLRFSGATSGQFIDIGQDCNGGFVIEGTDNPRLTVQNCGNVGIGGTPWNKLSVYTGASNVLDVFDTGASFGIGTQAINNLSTIYKTWDFYASKYSFFSGQAVFSCQVCAPNFKFTQYGSIQSFVGSVGASGTKTITICTDGGGVLNGALHVTVGLYVNGAGGNSVVSWIVGGYMGAGAMRIVEVARSSDTYGCIGVMTNPANCLIFTVGNCFAFNGMDYSVMVTSVNANTSALKIY